MITEESGELVFLAPKRLTEEGPDIFHNVCKTGNCAFKKIAPELFGEKQFCFNATPMKSHLLKLQKDNLFNNRWFCKIDSAIKFGIYCN